jgi:pimeloyl-ACP methyl ester carboxylesterase
LLGVSYGTQLAQAVMQAYPSGIRSVILDSTVVGLGTFPFVNPSADFNVLFKGCARDTACNKDYPRLSNVFYKLVVDLALHPVSLSVTHPLTHKQYTMLLTGDELASAIFAALYSTPRIPALPRLIYQASNQDYKEIGQLAFNALFVNEQFISLGMYYSVECAQLGGSQADYCQVWQVNRAPRPANWRVTSSLPTLVLSGEYDPITPPAYSKTVIQTLARSYFFEYPGVGHGVDFSAQCPLDMTLAFLRNPGQKPDSSCISKMTEPQFELRGMVF